MKVKNIFILIAILFTTFVIVACSEDANKSEEGSEKSEGNSHISEENGGELKITLSAQPPTLDPMMTSSIDTGAVARNIFETLVTSNAEYQPVPMLAESIDESDDGKTYSFNLRQGVKFHNGEEMTADDVVSSMNRWIEKSPVAGEVIGNASFEKEDDYTVVLNLAKPSSGVLDILASPKQFPAIMPANIIESASAEGVTEYVGTGPFELVEEKPNQYIHLSKYEDYQAVEGEASGLAGKREALVNDVYFYIVKDTSTRLAAVQTAEYDVISDVPFEQYDRVKENESVKTHLDPYGHLLAIYNKKSDMFSDQKMRQAVNTAINTEEIMLATFAHEELYELDHGYMNKDQKDWYSEAGIESYNQANEEKAKKLLDESGYNGEEINLIVTKDYSEQYDSAVVLEGQLRNIGMNVKLETFDWPTLLERRDDPKAWDILVTGYSTVSTPSQILYFSPNEHGWSDDEKFQNLLTEIDHATSQEEAQELWSELQGYAWNDYVPVSNFGTYRLIAAATDKVEGLGFLLGPIVWNTKVTE
ncbi:ABC transporter substrate-binding protein [Virgibacillus sp. W0181]|uniref:ABC transporter substrate-binding protein n=1 Tax=Virgibacillus sp. W0181 TaxID=3391581 RepID=UPI003F44E8CD